MVKLDYHWLLDLHVFFRRINLDGSLNHDDTQYTNTFCLVRANEYKPDDYNWRMYIHDLAQKYLFKNFGNAVITIIFCLYVTDLTVLSIDRPVAMYDRLFDIFDDCNDLYESTLLEELSELD